MAVSVQYRKFTDNLRKSQVEPTEGRQCGQSLFSRIPNGDMPVKVWLVLCFYSDVLFLKLDFQVFEFPKRFLFAVIRCLHDASSRSKHDGFGWYLKNRILTAMHGSGQRHESWVFQRQLAPTN
jgi:hypothetical protein